MKVFMIWVLFSFIWVACDQSLPSKEPIETTSTLATDAKIGPYYVSLDAPKQVNKNEAFTLSASLLNSTDNQVRVQHAAGIFYFVIRDSKGKQINTFAMEDVGEFGTLQANETVTESYEYKLDIPGFYKVSAIAKFTIGEGENQKDYEIETNETNIEVVTKMDHSD